MILDYRIVSKVFDPHRNKKQGTLFCPEIRKVFLLHTLCIPLRVRILAAVETLTSHKYPVYWDSEAADNLSVVALLSYKE